MFVGLLMTLQALLMAGELREVVTKLTFISLSSKRRIPVILRSSFLIWELTLNKKKIKLSCIIRELIFPFSVVKMPHTLQIMFLQKCWSTLGQRYFKQLKLQVIAKRFAYCLGVGYLEFPKSLVMSLFLQGHWLHLSTLWTLRW